VKQISTALTNFLLGAETFNRADLINIVLPNGQVINALFGNNVTSITYPSGLPATVNILGTANPWSPTDPTYPFTSSGGSSSTSIPMSQGQVITLSYSSGLISHGSDSVDPNGGFGVTETNSPAAKGYISPTPPNWCLLGGFANAAGNLVAQPFFIGNNLTIGPAPIGTTQLLLGVNDYPLSANTGSWTMNVVPPTYYATKYGAWERGPFTNKADFKLSAEQMKLYGFVPESVLYPGTTTSLMQVINLGMLAGSKVTIQTLFWPSGSLPSTGFSMGTMQLTQGQIGNVKNTGRSKIECDVFDLTYILNRPFPPHMIQTSCRHTFCDAGCTLIANNFRSTPITIDSSSTNLYINLDVPARSNSTSYVYGNLINTGNVIYMCTVEGTSAGSAPTFNSIRGATTTDGGVTWTSMNGGYVLGYVVYVTGQNAGLKKTVKAQVLSTGGLQQLQLLYPFPFAVAGGDTVRLVSGCDKTTATCENVYNNLIHFGGQPFVPNPEIAQ
jgi:Phage conserved hypothetical protein BR0599/Uncharacterized conserved protein (DUF2163)